MTEVCTFETVRVLQSVAECPIHADMRGPDKAIREPSLLGTKESNPGAKRRSDVAVGHVITEGAPTRTDPISCHCDVRGEQQAEEEPPGCAGSRVHKNAEEKDQESFRTKPAKRRTGDAASDCDLSVCSHSEFRRKANTISHMANRISFRAVFQQFSNRLFHVERWRETCKG